MVDGQEALTVISVDGSHEARGDRRQGEEQDNDERAAHKMTPSFQGRCQRRRSLVAFSETILRKTSGGASFLSTVNVSRAMHFPAFGAGGAAGAPRPGPGAPWRGAAVPRPSRQPQSLPNISLF